MIKSVNNLIIPWGVVIILFLATIFFRLISVPAENLIDRSVFIWFIYDQLPSLFALFYVFLKTHEFIRFSYFQIEIKKWYRYLLFVLVVTGIVLISFSIVSLFETAPVLMQLNIINDLTKNFSILFYIKILLLAPFFEELVFRGVLLNGFLNRYSPAKSILITSLLFSILHLNSMQLIIAFLLGLFTGWYFYKTRNLLSCILIHTLSNLIGITIIKYSVDKLHYQVITSDTRFFQIDNLWLVILSALSLLIVGFFYLFKSVMEDHSNKNLANDIMEPDVS